MRHPVVRTALAVALVHLALPAQSPHLSPSWPPPSRPAADVDPDKGPHDPSPLSDAELAMLRQQHRPRLDSPVASAIVRDAASVRGFGRVLWDEPGDGRIWAVGDTHKAWFGPDGFGYVPFLGSDAPRNWPLQLVLRSVRAGGRELDFERNAVPRRDGDRVELGRGAVRELYDVRLDGIEQTIVVDTEVVGDVEVEFEIRTELLERERSGAGVDFGNELGGVSYGAAFLVVGAQKQPIATHSEGNLLRLCVRGSQRGAGPVVIDPIVTTVRSQWGASLTRSSARPDVAYDLSTDRYLVVQEHLFSATDTDIFAELFSGDGAALAGTTVTIDSTILSHSWPRVANLNALDRFLIVMERFDPQLPPGQQRSIWGRTLDAASPNTVRLPAQLSAATLPDCVMPDVGGDSGFGRRWVIVFTSQRSASDHDVWAAQITENGQTLGSRAVETSAATIHTNAQISLSNGARDAPLPRWLIVYQFRFSATDWDVYGAAMGPDGTITQASTAIDRSQFNDMFPHVSTPVTDWTAGDPTYMVTFERQSPQAAMAKVVDSSIGTLGTIVPTTNLTQGFGLGWLWVRVDSDGCRFAVTSGAGTSRGNEVASVATLAVVNGGLVLHESPRRLGSFSSLSGVPMIASKRSGGGRRGDYGIAFIDRGTTPASTWFSTYQGYSAGGVTRRPTGCGSAVIRLDGTPILGETFTVSTGGTGTFGSIVGLPADVALPFCPGCTLGVDGATARSFLSLTIACDPALVGVTLAFQAYDLGVGPCLGSVSLSDTLDVCVR